MAPNDYDKVENFNVSFPHEYVAVVEINRPKKLNAFSPPMWPQIGAIFRQLSIDPDVRAVVLTGAGEKAFTAGLDVQSASTTGPLAESDTQPGLDPARRGVQLRRSILEYQDSLTDIERCSKPVIAVLHGISFGLAIDMTLCCDVRVAAADTRFCVKEIDVGLAADVGTLSRLPHANVPMSWAKEVCLTAREFTAEEALRVGLVSSVHASKKAAMDRAIDLAKLVAEKSPVAVAATKDTMNFSRDHTIADGLNHISLLNATMLQSEDLKDAMMSGIRKTKATFAKL